MKEIILASKSPRRKALLKKAGINFKVVSSNYKEDLSEKFSFEFIKKVSYCKAQDVAQSIDFDAIIISADTMVILDSVCLIKPRDFNEASFCLKKLSDKWHKVVTAVTLIDIPTGKKLSRAVETKVKFRKLNEAEITNYINSFKPFDKAGSYGIQDFLNEKTVLNAPPESFIEKIKGSFDNVMGLPVQTVLNMLEEIQR